jgi:hypothetical protein
MPTGLAIILIAGAAMFGWFQGWRKGYEDADKWTDYWYKESQRWMRIALDLRDKPDGGISRKVEKAPLPEPVKAMAKAVGASR